MSFFVYMLRCADGSFYVGHTDDLERRIAQHAVGEIKGYTQERRPVELIWVEESASREEALAFERRVKGWSRAKKEALIAGDWQRISGLARSSTPVRPTPARPELVEGLVPEAPGLRQAQPERGVVMTHALLTGNRRALAKAITLLESSRPDHRRAADDLLNAILPHTGHSIRLGISGVPGVGKSTFIEALGLHLISQGHRVAVLAIDPSSSLSGGSILGDKTRMERLSTCDAAFIRPSPTSGTLGGVAEKTRETMLLCEAAGYDVVIVETVGVGQSEVAVAQMTDLFVLLQLPNAGDDLQAIKKGVMELADLIVINKADLDSAAATRAQAQITSALRLGGPQGANDVHDRTRVMQVSALNGDGVTPFWSRVETFIAAAREQGTYDERRRRQALSWTWDLINARLAHAFREHPSVKEVLSMMLQDVAEARTVPSAAARELLARFEQQRP